MNTIPLSPAEKTIRKIKTAVELAEEWCEDQSNGMTEGMICIAAMKDIRRLIKEGECEICTERIKAQKQKAHTLPLSAAEYVYINKISLSMRL